MRLLWYHWSSNNVVCECLLVRVGAKQMQGQVIITPRCFEEGYKNTHLIDLHITKQLESKLRRTKISQAKGVWWRKRKKEEHRDPSNCRCELWLCYALVAAEGANVNVVVVGTTSFVKSLWLYRWMQSWWAVLCCPAFESFIKVVHYNILQNRIRRC